MRRAFVYTPPDYDKNTTNDIPCSTCSTAAGEDETGWGAQGRADLIMDNLIAAGKPSRSSSSWTTAAISAEALEGEVVRGAPAAPPGAVPAPPSAAPAPGAASGSPPARQARAAAAGTSTSAHSNEFSSTSSSHTSTRTIARSPISRIGRWPASRWAACRRATIGLAAPRQVFAARHLQRWQHRPNGHRRHGRVQAADQARVRELRQPGEAAPRRQDPTWTRCSRRASRRTFYVSPETAHEWQSWRRSLYQFAPLLFQK